MVPNEICYEIFSYLQCLSDFFTVRLVCKDWYDVFRMIQNDNRMNHYFFEILNTIQQITKNCKTIDLSVTSLENLRQICDTNSFEKWCPFDFHSIGDRLCVKLPNGKFYHLISYELDDSIFFKNQGNHKFCFHTSEDADEYDYSYCLFSIQFYQHKKPTINYDCDEDVCNNVLGDHYCIYQQYVFHFFMDRQNAPVTELTVFKQRQNKTFAKIRDQDLMFDVRDFNCFFSSGWLFVPYVEEIYDLKKMRKFKYDGKFSLCGMSHKIHFLFFGYDFCFLWHNGQCYRVIFYSKKIETIKITTVSNFSIKINDTKVHEEVGKAKDKFYFNLIRFPSYDISPHTNSILVESESTRDFFFIFISKPTKEIMIQTIHATHTTQAIQAI
jgi:hypothetical protein